MGCIPCAIVGLLFDDWIDEHFYNPWTVAITLFVYGVLFIIVENHKKKNTIKEVSFLHFIWRYLLWQEHHFLN